MSRTHRLLRGHFLRGMLHNDLIAPRGDTELAFFHALALAALPGLFHAYGALLRYVARAPRDPGRVEAMIAADRAGLVAFSMLALAFVAVLAWDELLPTRRDTRVLGPLPLPMASVLLAKAAAVVLLLSVCAAALNLFTAFVFPMVSGPPGAGLPHALLRLFVHALVLAAASSFVGCVAVAARGLVAGTGALRLAQLSLFVLLVQSAFLLPRYAWAMTSLGSDNLLLLALPPTWFVGLYATLTGSGRSLDHGLAATALVALLASVASALLSYRFAAEQRSAHVAGPVLGRGTRRRVESAIEALLLRSARERAAFWFVLLGLWRSASHRLTLTGYAAVGLATSGVLVALAGGGRTLDPEEVRQLLLRATFVVAFFVLLGLRAAFDRPAELSANWLFRLAAPRGAGELRRGARQAAIVVGTAPVLASLPALAAAGLDALSLALHFACGLVVVTASVTALLWRRRRVPFTCEAAPGAANLRLRWPLYIAAFLVFVASASALERAVLARPWLVLPCLAAALLATTLPRDKGAADAPVFEQEDRHALPSLELNA